MNYFRFKDKLMMPLMAITLLFCSCSKEELVMENGHGEKNGYRFVDLGLPSGTLWADFNIGTSSVEESGEYFAWGETLEKEAYDWYTYKWCQKSYNTLTKYCTSNEYGTKDDKKNTRNRRRRRHRKNGQAMVNANKRRFSGTHK